MKELEKLMKKPGNEYDETPGYPKTLYLNSINQSGILPYEEIIDKYPEITELHLSPIWKVVNIKKLTDELNIIRDYYYGESKYIGVDNKEALLIDNEKGVVMRYLGEYKKLHNLTIVRNYVFDNIMDEVCKLKNLKFLYLIDNQIKSFSQYNERAESMHLKREEDIEGIEIEVSTIGELIHLEELELVNHGIKKVSIELNDLQELRTINFSQNEKIDLTEVRGHAKLEHVKLSDIGAEEIPRFVMESKGTTKTLDLNNNQSIDIDDVTQLTKLESISLLGIKRIDNLHAILDMPNIERIYVNKEHEEELKHEKIERGKVLVQEEKTWAEHNWEEVELDRATLYPQ